jgi:hypothetical protein
MKVKLCCAALALAVASAVPLTAQTVTVVGMPVNFDAINDTGQVVRGFEIEADGIQPNDVTRVFGGVQPGCYIRYCTGSIVGFSGGVYIRWTSPYDAAAGQFTQGTPPYAGAVATGESCWTFGLGARYPAAGCEHFGISTMRNPTAITYRWLVEDANNPGQLTYVMSTPTVPIGVNPPPPAPVPVPIPHPIVNVIPPALPGGNVGVEFVVKLPPPPPPPPFVPAQYGDAKWVKVFMQELDNEVDVNDLLAGNPAVPDAAAVEIPWQLLQTNPNNPNGGVLHSKKPLNAGKHAVVRRYEVYKYTGQYDPLTHQALCVVAECPSPSPGELGDYVGAQMAGANLEIPSITVSKVGSGTVTGLNGKINCGGTCTAAVPAGTTVNLTASVPGSSLFGGWTGACTGMDTACSTTVNAAVTTTATFIPTFTLSIGRSGSGTVTGTPGGAFGTSINCGGACSAKFPQGAAVTLTAVPPAGHVFVNWSAGCTGTDPTCTVTIAKDTSVQAVFK